MRRRGLPEPGFAVVVGRFLFVLALVCFSGCLGVSREPRPEGFTVAQEKGTYDCLEAARAPNVAFTVSVTAFIVSYELDFIGRAQVYMLDGQNKTAYSAVHTSPIKKNVTRVEQGELARWSWRIECVIAPTQPLKWDVRAWIP